MGRSSELILTLESAAFNQSDYNSDQSNCRTVVTFSTFQTNSRLFPTSKRALKGPFFDEFLGPQKLEIQLIWLNDLKLNLFTVFFIIFMPGTHPEN